MSKQTAIEKHPLQTDICAYIYAQKELGNTIKDISEALKIKFDIDMNFVKLRDWMEKHPQPIECEYFEDTELFDTKLYESLITKESTEIEKMKAKYVVLANCNTDSHIDNGGRLNPEYLKQLKIVLEIELLNSKSWIETRAVNLKKDSDKPTKW